MNIAISSHIHSTLPKQLLRSSFSAKDVKYIFKLILDVSPLNADFDLMRGAATITVNLVKGQSLSACDVLRLLINMVINLQGIHANPDLQDVLTTLVTMLNQRQNSLQSPPPYEGVVNGGGPPVI